MSSFEPIAIIGQGCVLPGAHSPSELWQAVADGRDLTANANEKDWGIALERVITSGDGSTTDRTWSHRGGYISGFERVFDSSGFRLDSEQVAGLDSGTQWCLHAAREALHSAGLEPFAQTRDDVGVILGNLAYAPRSMQDYTARFWLQQQPDDADSHAGNTWLQRHRAADLAGLTAPPAQRFFSASAPAQLTARAIGAGGSAFCLDAACASSLYAIRLACEQLQDGRAKVMLAGALNHADDLYLHIGFTALQALSRDGIARPFDRQANGLVPGAGAAMVVLKRLVDARRDGDRIDGVIRGIGLSNDGRAGGFLSPSSDGQVHAISRAYQQCEIQPAEVSYIECHATGTRAGDATELNSLQQVFKPRQELAVASLKGNIGHLITAAGAAGLIRVLGAMKQGQLASSIHVQDPIAELTGGNLRLLREQESWCDRQPRIAGLNAFGFGGNNAHMIVQQRLEPKQWPVTAEVHSAPRTTAEAGASEHSAEPVVITAIAVRTADCDSPEALLNKVLNTSAAPDNTRIDHIEVTLARLGFPPRDLEHTLGQQLLMMQLVRDLATAAGDLDPDTTSVLIGMGTDPNTTRYATRTRLSQWLAHWREQGLPCDDDWLAQAREAITPGLTAAGVLGTMPNMPANRSNHQLDLRGPSYTIAGEENSGVHALQIAQRSLQHGDISTAIVGAVDLCSDELYRHALCEAHGAPLDASDAAVALVLKRKSDALQHGDCIIAELGQSTQADTDAQQQRAGLRPWAEHESDFTRKRFGHCHAAFGLLNTAIAALMLQHRLCFNPDGGQPIPDLSSGGRGWSLQASTLGVNGAHAQHQQLTLLAAPLPRALTALNGQRLYRFAGNDPHSLRAAIAAGREADQGSQRLAIIAADQADFEAKRELALERLGNTSGPSDDDAHAVTQLGHGIYLARSPLQGELGFVFTGAASAYPGMGRELVLALPETVASTIERFPVLADSQPWLDADMPAPESEFAVLQGCSLLSQIHARVSQDLLGLKPQAMLGVSSGETNSVFAAGAWHDMDAMFAEIEAAGMYQQWIAGDFNAARKALDIDSRIAWQAVRVIAPAERLQALLAEQTHVFLTMINAARDCVVAGESNALAKIMPAIEQLASAVVPLGHDIIAHCPVLRSWEAPWRQIHHRQTSARPDLRFYSNASAGSYKAEREAIADALTDQATNAVDFRRVVEAAYSDGVRIFVEHGPRALCSQWIGDALGSRPHLSVHLDRPGAGLAPLYEAVAQLWCAGIDVNYQVLHTMTSEHTPPGADTLSKTLNAHPPAISWPLPATDTPSTDRPASEIKDDSMPAAPVLDSALKPALADDEVTLSAINNALRHAPPPSYTMPERITEVAADHTAANHNPAASAEAQHHIPVLSAIDDGAIAPVASAVLQRWHAQLGHSHQHYLNLQSTAMNQLMQAHSAFSGAGTAAFSQQPATVVTSASAEPIALTQQSASANTAAIARSLDHQQVPATVAVSPLPAANTEPPRSAALSDLARQPSVESFPGPCYNREQLQVLAGGKISDIFGPLFKQQDEYPRQVRMPCPPLLLADRVLGIDATPGAMESHGSIWTETDVGTDAWYLHHGHMPAGIMIESGQADLLLISWMGADFENRGERVYRLLGCELTYRAGLPTIDDTLRYDIHVDGYAKQGDVRLFFFHYNCEIDGQRRLEVRHGQAGFFTDEELANSAGIIWDAASERPRSDLGLAPAPMATSKRHFDCDQVAAFAAGDLVACFGSGFEPTYCHQRTPTIAAGKMQLFDRVSELDHQGGPWGRGYLRAELDIQPDHWFFDGHFKNDPCMPGTLMFEGGMQVMAFYLASLGYTLARDGWRFEPVKDEAFQLLCRSQLIPGAKQLVCELFVHGIEGGSTPRLRVDMLCSVDGRKAFLGQSVGIELVPGWPLESRRHLLSAPASADVARDELFAFDEHAMAACAWGRPSQAFGPHYSPYDGPRRGPRLPGYPYHFISRIVSVEAQARALRSGGRVSVEYDVPPDAWYFAENSQASMPFPVLLEAALQPCGWLATFIGGGFQGEQELFFRNLDGTATWHRDVLPTAGTLRTEVENTSVSQVGSMTIVNFKVSTTQDSLPVYDMETVFGFFPEAALAEQAGLPSSDEERLAIRAPGRVLRPVHQRDARLFQHSLCLPGPMLCLLDRITDLHSAATATQQGHVRAEMDVDPQAWYFKAHFYGDPVQPGSLGLEMMLQCLQYFAIDQDLGATMTRPCFAAGKQPHSWSYRGQVLPHNKVVTCDLSVTAIERSAERVELKANATLWADDTKIYRAEQLSLTIVDSDASTLHGADIRLDCRRERWLNDHCPTWTVPALAMTCMLDQLASAAAQRSPGKRVIGLSDVRASRWLTFNDPVRYLRQWAEPVSASQTQARLLAWEESTASYEEIAQGTVVMGEQYRLAPKAWPELIDASECELPYASGRLFHQGAFQGMRTWRCNEHGSSARVDAGHGQVPRGTLNPGFLDACLHGIPHDNLQQWFAQLDADVAAYPLLVMSASFYGPAPDGGMYRVEARPRGLHAQWQLPHIAVQIIDADDQLWAELELLEAVLPKGPIGTLDPTSRRAFITEQRYQPAARLSQPGADGSVLSKAQTRSCNWLPGTLERIYGSDAGDCAALTRDIVAKEHIAALNQVHPATVQLEDLQAVPQARLLDNLLYATPLSFSGDDDQISIRHQPAALDLRPVRDYWRQQLDKPEGLEEDLLLALACRFVASLHCADAQLLNTTGQRGVLFIANHQVGVESMLLSILLGGFMRQQIVTLAKQEHRESWIGQMLQAFFAQSTEAPDLLHLLNRDDPSDVLKQMTRALDAVSKGQQSLLVHAGGTRSLCAGEALTTVSTALIGAAVAAGVDIVPLAFQGGLPLKSVAERLEFPVGYGQQQFVLGPRISCGELQQLTALQQKERILSALNPLLSDSQRDRPGPADDAFAAAVTQQVEQHGVNPVQAVLWLSLKQSALPLSAQSQRLIALVETGDGAQAQDGDEWLRSVSRIVFGR